MESTDYIRARVEGLERRVEKAEDELDSLSDIATEVRLLRKALDRWASLAFTVGGTILAGVALALILRGGP